MPLKALSIRASFQAKVLIPVIGLMALLLVLTIALVMHRVTAQFQEDATRKLLTAEAIFQNSHKIRARNLLQRYGGVLNEPRFKAAAQTDPATLRASLAELLEEVGGNAAFFSTEDAGATSRASRDPQLEVKDLETRCGKSVARALEGEANFDSVRVGQRLFDVVSVPVRVGKYIVGAVTFANEFGEVAAQELKQLTRGEIVLVTPDGVVASTLIRPESYSEFTARFNTFWAKDTEPRTKSPVQELILGGEHFRGLLGKLPSFSPSEAGYLLLSSYEEPLRGLQSTLRMFLLLLVAGLLFSTAFVWLLVGRATAPLRELRDSAERVSHGDFSRHVAISSRDECGELARAFNQMLDNLKSSREQLETTVETLKTTQAQLIQSEKLSAIGEFVAGVTHELNNPLTSVIGFAELLQQSDVSERHAKHLDYIVKAAQRCQKIVQSLLSFARQHKPERKLVNIHDLVAATIEILAYQLRTNNIEVKTQFDPQLPKVMADAHQLQQVLLNLMNNARQAIEAFRPNGWIRVSTDRVGNQVRIRIQDNGPGISEENLAKIFNPFFTTKEVGKGTGLGLSLCYGIIREHGGSIIVTSEEGQGALFTIELPIPKDTTEIIRPDTSFFFTGSTAGAGQGKRVLVVDDEDSIVNLIREALSEDGYEMDVARDGETALRQLRQNHYDATVCDWKMPGLSGQEVYERVRTRDTDAASRFIFITGDVVNEKTRKFLKEHGAICLAKPFSLDNFRAAVAEVISGRLNQAVSSAGTPAR